MLVKDLSIVTTVLCYAAYAVAIMYVASLRGALSGVYAKWTPVMCILLTSTGWLLAVPFVAHPFASRVMFQGCTMFLVGCLVLCDMLTQFFCEAVSDVVRSAEDTFSSKSKQYVVLPNASGIRMGGHVYTSADLALGLHVTSTLLAFFFGFVLHCIDLVLTKELLVYVH